LTNERGEITGAINCFYDITERKRAEQALKEAAKQQAALYRFVQRRHEARNAEDICTAAMDTILAVIGCDRTSILLLDQKGTMRFVASRGLSGRYRKEVEGHSPWEAKAKNPSPIYINDVDACDLTPTICKSIRTEGIGAVAFIPLLIGDKLIGKFMIYYNAPHVFTEAELNLSQTIAGQLALGIERKQAEASLRQTEERFNLLVEGAKDYAMFLLDPGNVITFWSAGAERVFGWTRAEAEGQPGDLIFTPEDRATRAVEKEIAIALAEGRAPDRRWHLRKDGSRFWADGVMMRLDHDSGELRALVKIARDATEERVAEEALRRARDELEQRVVERTAELLKSNTQLQGTIKEREQLERELLEISEREKRRIGEDLHDMVCQELAAAAFLLQTSAIKFARDNPEASKTLRESAQIVNRNVNLARELARGLQPMELTAAGLNTALKALAAQASENRGVLCEFKASRVRLGDDTVALYLYRIAQEAVNNAVKHGQAAKIVISMKREDGHICLQVADDGKGFSAQKKYKGLGLNLMKYRANALGGTWQIKSRKGSGTIVTVCIPLA
jgi:PAS domain S-box-containing protein